MSFKNFIFNATTKHKYLTVSLLSVFLIVANAVAVLMSLANYPIDTTISGKIQTGIYMVFIAPQMISILLPVSKTYLLVIFAESSLIMFICWFFTKPKKSKPKTVMENKSL